MNTFHLIVGDGPIGRAVADELTARGLRYRLGSRHPSGQPPHGSRGYRVDALDAAQLVEASRGASHLYLTLGLPYDTRTWQAQWPPIVENAIEAARANRCTLVFFDNVYAYGPAPLRVPIREDHPRVPPSAKGRVRLALELRLLRANREQGVPMVIGRSADFYGPGVTQSMLYVGGVQRHLRGQRARVLADPDRRHAFTYTLDAARALVTLALDPGATGRVWHLPTVTPAPTMREWLGWSARIAGAPAGESVMPRWLLRWVAVFVPIVRETREMLYQFDHDYVFDASAFIDRYPDFRVTPPTQGLSAMIASLRGPSGG